VPSAQTGSSGFTQRRSGATHKVIPEKEHPIKNLIRRQKIESTKGTKSTNKSKIRSCLSCFSWTILLVNSLLEINYVLFVASLRETIFVLSIMRHCRQFMPETMIQPHWVDAHQNA